MDTGQVKMDGLNLNCEMRSEAYVCKPTAIKEQTMSKPLRSICIPVLLCFALAAGGCASHNTSLGTKLDDTVITTLVKAALYDDPAVRGSAVTVQTVDGVVQLSGFVASRAEAIRAVEIARAVDNVRNVLNQMTVRN